MGKTAIEIISDFLKLDADTSVGTGARDQEIRDVEERLGFELPQDYKEFLAQFGYVQVVGWHCYGIDLEEPRAFHSVDRTLYERSQLDLWRTRTTRRHQAEMVAFYESWPSDCVILCGDARPVVLFSVDSHRSGQVAQLVQQVRGEGYRWQPIQWWPSFTAWLQYEYDEFVEMLDDEADLKE